jgi:hypothetical protein
MSRKEAHPPSCPSPDRLYYKPGEFWVNPLAFLEHICYKWTMNALTASPSPKRRRGGQPGNCNAVKHGFYSTHFRKVDVAALEHCQFSGLADEIGLLRLYIRRVVQMGAEHNDFYETLNLLRLLCMAAATLTRLVKTQRLLAGEDDVSLAIRQAIEQVHQELVASGDFSVEDPPVMLSDLPPDDPPATCG